MKHFLPAVPVLADAANPFTMVGEARESTEANLQNAVIQRGITPERVKLDSRGGRQSNFAAGHGAQGDPATAGLPFIATARGSFL